MTAPVPEQSATRGQLREFDQGMWYRFLDVLQSGTRIPLAASVYCYLLEHRPLLGASRSGFVIALDGRLVRLSAERTGLFGQALRGRLTFPPEHAHRLECTMLSDGWELVYCQGCGEEW